MFLAKQRDRPVFVYNVYLAYARTTGVPLEYGRLAILYHTLLFIINLHECPDVVFVVESVDVMVGRRPKHGTLRSLKIIF